MQRIYSIVPVPDQRQVIVKALWVHGNNSLYDNLTIAFVLVTEDIAANVNHTVLSIMFSVVPSMTLCTLRLCFDSDSSAFCF